MPDHGPRYGVSLLERIAPGGKWDRRACLRVTPFILYPLLVLSVVLKALATGNKSAIFYSFVLLSILFIGLAWMLNNRGANKFARLLLPQGNASPYKHDFSFEKALVMQGRVAEALEGYEAQIRLRPLDVDAYLETAELNAKQGSIARAIELFRQLRQLDSVSDEQRMYATNRLIDLYLKQGPENSPERVRSELRYLIAHYPNSRAGISARDVLARMTADENTKRDQELRPNS